MPILFIELACKVVDVINQKESNRLQLIELQHHTQLIHNLQFLLNTDLLLEVDVQSQEVTQDLLH